MSRQGLVVARQQAALLPAFGSLEEARDALYRGRDTVLGKLEGVEELRGSLDYSPESLKSIERWFFEAGKPSTIGGCSVLQAIAFYLGEVFCRHASFRWIVQENAFAKGKYSIGVTKGLLSIMLIGVNQLTLAGNKRMQSLWREFKKYS
jgi:hypothetical protein